MSNYSQTFTRNALALAIAGLVCAQFGHAADTGAAVAPMTNASMPAAKLLAEAAGVPSKAAPAKDVRVDGAAVNALETPHVTSLPAEQAQFGIALTDIGLALLRDQPEDQNAVASSFSLANALGLVQIASKGKTARELASLFQHASSGTALLSTRMGEINQAFLKPLDSATLTSANRLWVSQSLAKTIDPTYAKKAQKYFQSDAHRTAFELPQAAVASINEWVKGKTQGNIPQLLQPAQLTASTHLVVTNAVYFKGAWATPFDASRTVAAPFALGKANSVNTLTMRNTFRAGLSSKGGTLMLEIPYKNDELSMQIVLPAEGQSIGVMQTSLTGAQWSALATGLKTTLVDVSMPRFKIGGKVMPLKHSLQKMGVETVFTQAADLSALSQANGLMLDDVYQAATVQVDEEGAEAAAATAAVGVAKSLSFPTRVELNRPFLFAIVHKPTQTQLFVGRVMNPAL